MKPRTAEPTWLDHALMTGCALLAAYAAGAGVHLDSIAHTMVLIISMTSFMGYVLARTLARSRILHWDGVLYAVAVITGALFARSLNVLLPEGGYPAEIAIAGLLSWMLAVGALFAWRDSTMLFQCVPCIALFGVVGCWDYREGPALFFAFLVLATVLFARSHGRAQLIAAHEEIGAPSGLSVEELVFRLRAGPWRKMAGPEWALLSAAIVVVLSLIGAPLLQGSVQGIAGFAKAAIPTPPPTTATTAQTVNRSQYRLGRGPVRVRKTPVFEVRMDRARYLRALTYLRYSEGSWLPLSLRAEINSIRTVRPRLGLMPLAYDPHRLIDNGQEMPFEIRILSGAHDRLFLPGEPLVLPLDGLSYYALSDGTVYSPSVMTKDRKVSATVLVPPDDAQPRNAGSTLLSERAMALYRDTDGIPSSIQSLAWRAVGDVQDDFEKALRIQREIERRVKYNLLAAETPGGVDPVEHFLFESKEGYCDLFASAMALMARSVGLPARVVSGYFPTEPSKNGTYVLRESDRHMWAEILFEGVGWVPFDPTEGAAVINGLGRGSSTAEEETFYAKLPKEVTYGILGVLGVGAVVLLFTGGRGKPAIVTFDAGERKLARLVHAFEAEVTRQIGKTRHQSQTLSEFAGMLSDANQSARDLATSVAKDLEAALYGASFALDDLSAKVSRSLKQLRASLVHN